MKKRALVCTFLAALVAASMPASAVVISIGAFKDNTLYEDPSGELSNGAGLHLFAGRTVSDQVRRAVLAFDIAGNIPGGATINSASLRLNMSRCGPTCTTTAILELHRLLADWGEGASDAGGQEGMGAQALPGDATWVYTFYSTDSWTNEGGDFAGAASASTPVTNVGNYSWNSSQLALDVQNWLNTPSSNYGWILFGGEDANATAKRFESRETSPASFRPQLTIDYTPIPEPSTILFVSAGMIGLFRFRRR